MARNTIARGGYSKCAAITTSDTVSIASGLTDAILVTTAGNLVFLDANGNVNTITAAPVGIYEIQVSRVNATSTTATASALYY